MSITQKFQMLRLSIEASAKATEQLATNARTANQEYRKLADAGEMVGKIGQAPLAGLSDDSTQGSGSALRIIRELEKDAWRM